MPRKLPKVLSEEERQALLDQLNTRYPTPHRNLCMLRLMLETGLRAGEVVALRPDHAPFPSRTMSRQVCMSRAEF